MLFLTIYFLKKTFPYNRFPTLITEHQFNHLLWTITTPNCNSTSNDYQTLHVFLIIIFLLIFVLFSFIVFLSLFFLSRQKLIDNKTDSLDFLFFFFNFLHPNKNKMFQTKEFSQKVIFCCLLKDSKN